MFEFHRLNKTGIYRSHLIQKAFENLVKELKERGGLKDSRELSIAITKLEEACFFSKRAMAIQKENQE